jgi:hypothetical protein
MRALKTLVIGLAVLIVAGLTVVAFTVVNRAGDGAATGAAFGDVRVMIPPGSMIESTMVDGGRLVATLVLLDGSRRTLVVDLATGRRLGTIRFVPGAPSPKDKKP